MQITQNSQIKEAPVQMEDAKNTTMKILIGPDDKSKNITMRQLKISPGGHTPYHTHNFEHIIKIERGKGIVVNENNEKYKVTPSQSLFIKPNEKHQFQNPYKEPFEFLCIIPNT